MKYIKVEWPEIQDYMDNPDYPEECKFQKLADYVSKHGINNWREYYYKYILK